MTGGLEAIILLASGVIIGANGRAAIGYWASLLRTIADGWRHRAAPMPVPEPAAEPVRKLASGLTDAEFETIHGWAKLNPWYTEDFALRFEAECIHNALNAREPHLSLESNLVEVTAEMHRRHPEIAGTRQ